MSEKMENPEQRPPTTTSDLLSDAILAVSALSNHYENKPDLPRMYKANSALRCLWEIDQPHTRRARR